MPSQEMRIWMWTEACARLDEASRLERTFFRPVDTSARRPLWEPPADIFESATDIWICIALPGVELECLSVEMKEEVLSVTAERRLPTEQADMLIRRLELPYGRFERRFEMPKNLSLINKTLSNGCLYLRFQKGHAQR